MTTEARANPPRACVIGWPVAHSRSPLIHNFWLRELGIEGSYERAAVAPDDVADFVRSLAVRGFTGANVTLPHKEAAFALCEQVTPVAARLRAVNTLWLEDGRLFGDNTDVEGFLRAVDEAAPGWASRTGKAVVLGAGGAARAIVESLGLREIPRVVVINRTAARAREIADRAKARVEVASWAEAGAALEDADLLVNTTSLGMNGQPPLEIDLEPLPKTAVVCDIVYVPLETTLLVEAKARGLVMVGGLGMLLHQAVPGFARWFGVEPRVTPELRSLVEADIRVASRCSSSA